MAARSISGGTVVSADRRRARPTCSIDGETIAAVLAPGQADALGVTADRTIDATGKYVVPGGVDVHTHMELPFGGTAASDTFETGTIAAAWGGVTTIVDFAVQRTGERVQDGLADWHAKADGNCAIDYGFHMIIGGVDDDALKAMTYLVDNEGITSFKLFMAYPGVFYADDGQILRAMQNAGESGAVMMMHAENGIAIDVLVAQALARGETDPKYHSLHPAGRARGRGDEPRHPAGQGRRQRAACTSCTCRRRRRSRRSPRPATRARTCSPRRARSTSTCRSRTSSPSPASRAPSGCARRRCARSTSTTRRDLWKGLRMNELAVVSTDHCPFCMKEQKELGLGDFSKIPNGIGGVEHRMELLYQGVVNGEITLERWVETCATTPARMFGLYPAKGIIAPGADADVLVWDPNGHTSIGVDGKHHMNMDHSAYEGFEVDGKVDTVLSRGTVVVENDTFTGTKGHGRYVKRGLSQYLV